MKKLVLLLLIIISLNLVSAAITVENFQKKEFKIGEQIYSSIIIKIDTNEQYFLEVEIKCSSYNLDFYKIPIDKNTNFIDIPPLTINKNFIGICRLEFKIIDINKNTIEKIESEEIEIKNKISLEFNSDKKSYKPGETIIIKGKSEKDSKLTFFLKNEDEIIDQIEETINNNFFSVNLKLPEKLSAGIKQIIIKAEDKYENSAERTLDIEVLQIAKSIKLEINNKELNPNEEISFNAKIFDQSDSIIPLEISYKILDLNNNVINSITSTEENTIKLGNLLPGEYIIKAVYKDLEDSDKFIIKELKKIDFSIENGILVVENKGNTKYIENIIVEAKIIDITYKIPINLDLKINEKIFIDLKKELPSNKYIISIKSNDQKYEIGEVEIKDERPISKKLSQGISQITGSTIIETNEIVNIFYLALFLIFLGFILIFFLNKRLSRKKMDV